MIQFDPAKHKDKQLYEIQTILSNKDVHASGWIKSNVPFEEAAKTPWFFVVEDTE